MEQKSKTFELKQLVDYFEKERDKLLDQVQYIKGNADRMEWTIKTINTKIQQIEKEEAERESRIIKQMEILRKQKEESLKVPQEIK